jgi:hypothetical protein
MNCSSDRGALFLWRESTPLGDRVNYTAENCPRSPAHTDERDCIVAASNATARERLQFAGQDPSLLEAPPWNGAALTGFIDIPLTLRDQLILGLRFQ